MWVYILFILEMLSENVGELYGFVLNPDRSQSISIDIFALCTSSESHLPM